MAIASTVPIRRREVSPRELRKRSGMAGIRVGTAGWTDKSLIGSGWYPADAGNPEKRLRYYATQFPLVEVDSAYYAAERVAPRRVCVEFRNRTWMSEDNQKETLDFLSVHGIPYVCVDEPQGYPNSVPPVLAATSDLAVVRLHGHSDQWQSNDIQQRFRYRYSDEELREWAGQVQRLAGDADETHVVFNNCYRDYAHVNAQELERLISPPTRGNP